MAGSIIGGIFGQKAAKSQASAIKDAAETAAETQRYMFDTSVGLSEPWRAGGQNALAALQYELGLGALPTNLGATTRFRVGNRTFDTREEAEEFQQSFRGGGGAGGGIAGFSDGSGTLNRGPIGGGPSNAPTLVWNDKAMQWTLPQNTGTPIFNERTGEIRAVQKGGTLQDVATGGGGGGGGGGQSIPGIEEINEGGFAYQGFQKTPGYDFQLDEGQRAINRSLAARGRALSGSAVKEGMRFSQGLADQTYSNHLARLANLAGLGSGVAQQQGQNAIATGQGLAQTGMSAGAQIGNARASGYSALGQGIGGGVNALAQFAGMFSDRRLKTDIRRIGKTAEGYPKYEFRYLWDAPGAVRVGVMADEVPEELTFDVGGFRAVNYAGVTL